MRLNGVKLIMARIVLWLLLLFMMAVIFGFSAQNGEDSGDLSEQVTQVIVHEIEPDFDEMPQDEQIKLMDKAHVIVRKSAHFLEYVMLAVLLYLLLCTYQLKRRGIWSWLGATLYAVTDEVHQLYVGERMGSVKDVLIDSCGAAAGVMIAFAAVCIIRKRRSKV